MALISNIQKFCTHDGEGIRTTVFLKGCPLRCIWCHNPENLKKNNEILFTESRCIYCGECVEVCENKAHEINGDGHIFIKDRCNSCMECTKVCPSNCIEAVAKEMTSEQVIKEVLKDKAFFGDNGGITLSGGEPLMQQTFAIDLLKRAKENGITTAIETCGFFNGDIIEEVVKYTDMFLWDIKETDTEKHISFTGQSDKMILTNLFTVDKYDVKILLRFVIVKTINLNEENLKRISDIYKRLNNCIGVELLAYHAYGGSKNSQLGYSDNGNKEWMPSCEDMENARLLLKSFGVPVIY